MNSAFFIVYFVVFVYSHLVGCLTSSFESRFRVSSFIFEFQVLFSSFEFLFENRVSFRIFEFLFRKFEFHFRVSSFKYESVNCCLVLKFVC